LTFVPVAVPLFMLLTSNDSVVKTNAKESLNFHLNVWFWAMVIGVVCFIPGLIAGLLSFLTFGLSGIIFGILFAPLALLGLAWHWGLPALAVLHCLANADEPYRYPFIFRIL
jgi:uncharacterized protein